MKRLTENKQSNFVTDRTGAEMLNVSINTFRTIGTNAGAVYFFGRSRRTDMNKVRESLEAYRA